MTQSLLDRACLGTWGRWILGEFPVSLPGIQAVIYRLDVVERHLHGVGSREWLMIARLSDRRLSHAAQAPTGSGAAGLVLAPDCPPASPLPLILRLHGVA